MAGWRLEHTYAGLPALMYTRVNPTPVREPGPVMLNRPLAAELGLDPDALASDEGVASLAGNRLPRFADPLAMAYAGHQFGAFVGLGDGRAILLGEQVTPRGDRMDIQLKGSGRTPYSRRGDGRAALGPMLREFLMSEAMHALGIPTTRSLAVVTTGEPVYRERVLAGAVLTRVASSHLRVGTFEWAAAHQDLAALRALVDYTLVRHYPHLADTATPAATLLAAVIDRQAATIARWQAVGFVHGVMNTDNMALSGETIDYGPCAFLDGYSRSAVFSSIDWQGRYAFGNQPSIARWNLARLADALLPVLDADQNRAIATATDLLDGFMPRYEQYWLSLMRAKLGLVGEQADDRALVDDLFAWMEARQADFTNTFRALTAGERPREAGAADPAFDRWHERWDSRRSAHPEARQAAADRMRGSNPAVIPRNRKVEEALDAAITDGDVGPLHRLLAVLAAPFDHDRRQPEFEEPGPSDPAYRTFCGT